jgi:DNA repair exonuclease SbcCD ATPase subunit
MKQAKQHSQDLRETDEFLHTLISSDSPDKEKMNSHKSDNAVRQVNGRPKVPRLDPISRFSDPPAPPPQQPLPEKPDAARRPSHEPAVGALKRTDTEKPSKPGSAVSSPVSRDSSQIISLIEALSTTKKELEAQNSRVKELEDLLRQERSARESAEEKALLQSQPGRSEDEAAPENPDEDSVEQEVPEVEEITKPHDIYEANGLLEGVETEKSEHPVLDAQTEKLQEQLNNMVTELVEMKQQVETFKQRAEKAEDESAETRKSLAEMIESIRREREAQAKTTPPNEASLTESHILDAAGEKKLSPAFHGADSRHLKEVENAVTALTQKQRHNMVENSTPYASMLGVVLLGVGLMAYLNGWQKIEK